MQKGLFGGKKCENLPEKCVNLPDFGILLRNYGQNMLK
jgi:hypothetical protein